MTGHELDDPGTMTRKPEIGIDYEARKTEWVYPVFDIPIISS